MLLFLLPKILLALDVNAASRVVQNLVELAFDILPRIVWAIGIILLTRLAIIWISSLTRKSLVRIAPTLRKFVVQAVEILTLVVG